MLVVSEGLLSQVLLWKVSTLTQLDPPSSDFVGEGPVLSIRYSLDAKLIGIQRSNHEIQFRNRETGDTFSQRCKPDSESILGFFWTDCPICDVILIKTRFAPQNLSYQLKATLINSGSTSYSTSIFFFSEMPHTAIFYAVVLLLFYNSEPIFICLCIFKHDNVCLMLPCSKENGLNSLTAG